MLALRLRDRPELVSDHPAPERAAGEARIRMRLAGVCDTDLQLARGYMSYRGVLGHEFVGEVVEDDSGRWRGRRVVADINAGCGLCEDCRQQDGHHCAHRSVLGILGRDGALAEELVVPERCLVEVPESVRDEQAVFAEPLAAALHVLDELDGSRGPAAVLGDGKLGLLISLALAAAGVEVSCVGHHRSKLELARCGGAATFLESELDGRVARWPLVVEATGSAAGLERALSVLAPRGTLVLKTTLATPVSLDLSKIVVDELRVVGSRCGDMKRAISQLEAGSIDPTPLIAERFALAEADRALARAGEPGTLKVLVQGI